MVRLLTSLVAALLVVGAAPAADAKKVTLRWYGQSFFDLESSQGTHIVFDPHAIEAYGRVTVNADLILVSHFHDDHTQVRVVQNYEKAKVLPGLKGNGKRVDWNIVDEKYSFKKGEDIRVRSVGTYHDTMQGMERGKNAVFIVEVDGLRIVHLGDLGHTLTKEQIEKIGPVDVLLIPVGGVYTINGNEAKRVMAQLKPRLYTVPMHFGTKVFDEVLPVDEFLEEQKHVTDLRKKKSNELVIPVDLKLNDPEIAVLHYGSAK